MVRAIQQQLHIRSPLHLQKVQALAPLGDGVGSFATWQARDEAGQLWVFKLAHRQQTEALPRYAARCWETAVNQVRLGRLAHSLGIPRVPTPLVVSAAANGRDALLRDALGDIEAFGLDRILSDGFLAKPYPLWAVAYKYQAGHSLAALHHKSTTPPLDFAVVSELVHDLAHLYTALRERGFFYMPSSSHILINQGQIAGYLGLGHGTHLVEIWRNSYGLDRFAQGLQNTDTAPAEIDLTGPERESVADHLAMQSFGALIYDLVRKHQGVRYQNRAQIQDLLRIGSTAWRGLPWTVPLQAVSDGPTYQSWGELIADLNQESKSRPSIRVGIALDYANTLTGLCGWDLDLSGLAAHFDSYSHGRRVVYKGAVIVTTPRNAKERTDARLQRAGFSVVKVSSPTEKANQADDRKLMEIMLARASQIDELILVTADGDYADTVRALKGQGITVRIVHFSNLSHKYSGLIDEAIDGRVKFRRLIHPGIAWGHRTTQELT